MPVGATRLLLPGRKPEEEHQGSQGCVFADQFLGHTRVPASPTETGINALGHWEPLPSFTGWSSGNRVEVLF